ncbi:Maff2 family protein [Peptoniphilus sp. GNH]|nr:Maff2 family protein [Peptoniphilus sp. GNH]
MDFIQQSVQALGTLVTAIGAGLGAWGIVNLIEGYGGDNPGAKSQGIKQLMAGGGLVLIAQQVIPLLANQFNG